MSTKPMFEKIYIDLENLIISGNIKKGSKIYTEAEVVEKYNVSRITARRALTELTKSGYIERKKRTGSFVIYPEIKPTPKSSFGQAANHMNIALVVPFSKSIVNHIFEPILKNTEKYNISTSFHITNDSVETERSVLKSLLSTKPDGILVTAIEQTDNLNTYLQLHQKGIPIVFVDQYLPWLNMPYIASDNYKGMYDLTEWIIKKDYKKIAFLFTSAFKISENERLKGFMHAMQFSKLPLHDWFLINLDVPVSGDDMHINRLKENLITEHFSFMQRTNQLPEVVMCINDMTAVITIKVLNQLGLCVPEDITVTGFDNDAFYNFLNYSFTTVAQDFETIGVKAIETLIDIKEGRQVPVENLIETSLVIR